MTRIISHQKEASPEPKAALRAVWNLPVAISAFKSPRAMSHTHTTMEQALDKGMKSSLAKFTARLSPIALSVAYTDWAMHLASAPGKRLELLEKALKRPYAICGPLRQ